MGISNRELEYGIISSSIIMQPAASKNNAQYKGGQN